MGANPKEAVADVVSSKHRCLLLIQEIKHLNRHGTLLVEHSCKQAQTVAQLMRSNGYINLHCLKDTAEYPHSSCAERG